jgi:preprotein translocase SecF subunit
MQWINPDIAIDFMGARKKAFMLSGLMVAVSLISVAVLGLNMGIDFKGGTAVIVTFKGDATTTRADIEASVAELVRAETGDSTSQVTVQDFDVGVTGEETGDEGRRYLMYTEVTSLIADSKRAEIVAGLKTKYGADTKVDLPREGADTFYLTFTEDVSIPERKADLNAYFSSIGFKQVGVVSDTDRQQDVEYFKELNLLLDESANEDETGEAADLVLGREAWEKKKAKILADKKDKRFTVTVEEVKAKVTEKLAADFGAAFEAVESSTSVSPSVGEDLLNNGLLAILYAIMGILIYITLRFDFRFAPGAVVALLHDVIITIGIFSILQVKFSLPIIAALLTIVGYSLNDTIVVLDRVRETFETFRGRDLKDLLNRAINGTLSRTVLTSFTTLLVIISILTLGGGLIRDFAFALAIGVVVGTYSSIFVASPLVYYMDQYLKRKEATRAREARGGAANAVA